MSNIIGLAQLHLCSRQDGPHMTGCIGIYSTCTSTTLQLQPSACGNETSSIHLYKHSTPVQHCWAVALCMEQACAKQLCPVLPEMNLFWHWSPLALVSKKTTQEDHRWNSELPCYEQSYAQEQLPVHQASSAQGCNELSCSPKLQLSHVRGIFSLQRAGPGLSTCRQSHSILQYDCLSRSKSLANIIDSERLKLWKNCRDLPDPSGAWTWGLTMQTVQRAETEIAQCSRHIHLMSLLGTVGDRDLGFAPANPATQSCELAELDYGRELNWSLFPRVQVPISGVSAVLCCSPLSDWGSLGNLTHTREGQLVALRGGRKELSSKAWNAQFKDILTLHSYFLLAVLSAPQL